MFVIRPFKDHDLKLLLSCANKGKGMTSLPKDPFKLKMLLKLSRSSFNFSGTPPLSEYYGFVLEDKERKVKAGVSAIKALAKAHKKFRHYRVKEDGLYPEAENIHSSELCSLYLLPEFRKEGVGKLLSLARLHFIASFPERFQKGLIAELRGYLTEAGKSPLWESLGRKLVDIPYPKASIVNAEGKDQAGTFFYNEPVLFKDVSDEVKLYAGQTHTHTKPAKNMLEDEGFQWTGLIDIVDGGPVMYTEIQNLKILQTSKLYSVHKDPLKQESFPKKIVSNNRLDFRAVMTQFEIEGDSVRLPPAALSALKVNPNDLVRI